MIIINLLCHFIAPLREEPPAEKFTTFLNLRYTWASPGEHKVSALTVNAFMRQLESFLWSLYASVIRDDKGGLKPDRGMLMFVVSNVFLC